MFRSSFSRIVATLILTVCSIAALYRLTIVHASTGSVVLLGTVIGTAGSFGSNGNTIAKVFDGDTSTWWDAPDASGDWAGLDLGSGNTASLVSYRIVPRPGDGAGDYEPRIQGGKIQASTTADFSSGNTDLDTVPAAPPFYVRGGTPGLAQLLPNQRTATSTAFRYFRFLSATNGYGEVAELQFIAGASTTSNAKPVAPVISPWGGRFTSGSTTVTLSSLTTSASLYYTTDGTTPTTGSTLYSAPFSFSFSGGKTLKVLASDAGLSTTSSDISTAIFKDYGFKPNEDWYEDHGVYTEAHAGGVLLVSGRYYWCGADYNSGNPNSTTPAGIWLFSSTDLLNWRVEGNLLPLPAGYSSLTRPHIIYNVSTAKYVLWAHLSSPERAGVATASTITGPWTWSSTTLDPDTLGFKDNSLFVDGTTGYVVYTEGTQTDIIISRLSSDYLTTDGNKVTVLAGGQREAPVLFKRGSVYFLITSATNYYASNLEMGLGYITSSAANPLSGWGTSTVSMFASDPLGGSYNGQSSFVLQVPNKVDGFIMGTDYWPADVYNARQVWLPLTFATTTSVRAGVPASWDLSTFANSSFPRLGLLQLGRLFLPSAPNGHTQ